MTTGVDPVADEVVRLLAAQRSTVAVAESLTGGLLCAALVSVPGASAVVRGGLVAYTAEAKTAVLGVPTELVDRYGTVAAETAVAMAEAARALFGADWAVATTGVAGPEPLEGRPPGSAHLAVAGPRGTRTVPARTPGDRAAVRAGTTAAALRLLRDALAE